MTVSLAIVGSRTVFPTIEEIDLEVAKLALPWPDGWDPDHPDVAVFAQVIDEEIDGWAPGADDAGGLWAESRGIPVHPEPITEEDVRRWGKYVAPKVRNRRVSERCTLGLAFWSGLSSGTCDFVTRMVLRRKVIEVVPTKKAAKVPKHRIRVGVNPPSR